MEGRKRTASQFSNTLTDKQLRGQGDDVHDNVLSFKKMRRFKDITRITCIET
jgi:hypothetical protein